MPNELLCEGSVSVSMSGSGDRTVLVVKNGTTVRFWANTADLEEVLNGDTLQLSAYGAFCKLEGEEGQVAVEYALDGESTLKCAFPIERLRNAIEKVRTRIVEDLDTSSVRVEQD